MSDRFNDTVEMLSRYRYDRALYDNITIRLRTLKRSALPHAAFPTDIIGAPCGLNSYHYGYDAAAELRFWRDKRDSVEAEMKLIKNGIASLDRSEADVIRAIYIEKTVDECYFDISDKLGIEVNRVNYLRKKAVEKLSYMFFGRDGDAV